MPIIIRNAQAPALGDDPAHTYIVRINDGPPLAVFRHDRRRGLVQCLRDAADALEKEEGGLLLPSEGVGP